MPSSVEDDTCLVILEPQMRPRVLAGIWDGIYLENKVQRKAYALYIEARQTAHDDLKRLPSDDFFNYFWPRYFELLKAEGKEPSSTEEAKMEILDKYMPRLMKAWRSERFESLLAKRYAEIDFEAAEAEVRSKKKSAHRAKNIELQQEILGRLAYDVCLEGIWKGDRLFSRTVWEKYREQASSYGLEPNHYGKTRPEEVKKVGKNLDYIERRIVEDMQRTSPFRRNP